MDFILRVRQIHRQRLCARGYARETEERKAKSVDRAGPDREMELDAHEGVNLFSDIGTRPIPPLFWREWTIAVMLPTERCLQCRLHFPDRITVSRIGSFSRQARLSVESGKEQKGR